MEKLRKNGSRLWSNCTVQAPPDASEKQLPMMEFVAQRYRLGTGRSCAQR